MCSSWVCLFIVHSSDSGKMLSHSVSVWFVAAQAFDWLTATETIHSWGGGGAPLLSFLALLIHLHLYRLCREGSTVPIVWSAPDTWKVQIREVCYFKKEKVRRVFPESHHVTWWIIPIPYYRYYESSTALNLFIRSFRNILFHSCHFVLVLHREWELCLCVHVF